MSEGIDAYIKKKFEVPVENLSEGLQKRLRENGLPLKLQEQLMAKG